MGMLLEEIFRTCDNIRVADATEEKMLSDLAELRNALTGAVPSRTMPLLERYFRREEEADGYMERAYFYEGFRAAVRLLRECGLNGIGE